MTAPGRALAACGAAALIFFMPGQAEPYGAPKLLSMSVCAAAAWAALLARGGWRRTAVDAPLGAFLAVCLASAALSADPYAAIVGGYGSHAFGLMGLLLCAVVFLAAAWSQDADPEAALEVLLWAAGAAAALALLEKAGVRLGGLRPHPSGRLGGLQGDPVLLGSCLLLFLPVSLQLARCAAASRRTAAWVCGPLVAAALFLTLSRGAWLGAAAGVAATLALSGAARASRRALLGGVVVLAVLGAAAALLRQQGRSDSARVELWRSLAPAAAERPLFGSGPYSVQTLLRRHRTEGFLRALGPQASQVSAHNDLLEALVTVGLGGLAAYLWLLFGAWSALREALRDPPRARAAAAAAGALFGLFVQAKFNPVPLSALVLAALLLGASASGPPRPGGAGPFKGAVLLVCLALSAAAWRLCAADRQLLLGRSFEAAGRAGPALAAYRAAVRLNPYEQHYRLQHARFLSQAARAAAPGAARLELYDEAARSGADLAARRPALADGWSLQGTYHLLAASEGAPGRLEPARDALDAALARDPHHPALLENRLQLARALGERDLAARLSSELSRVVNIKR